jgi:hypothetical protein
MARYAMVHQQTGFVANVIMWDPQAEPDLAPPPGYTFVEDTDNKAGPGGTYDGTTFVPPPSPTTLEAETETKAETKTKTKAKTKK